MRSITWYKSLDMPKYRRQHGFFIIEGKRAVNQILTHYRDSIEELICTDATASAYVSESVPIRTVSETDMKHICVSHTPQGVAALVRIPAQVYTEEIPKSPKRVILLEHIQDPGNVGTIIRTAAAFGIDGVILSGGCADPFSPKATQSTAGSVLSLWIRKTDKYMQAVSDLKKRGYGLTGADLGGSELLDSHIVKTPYILALGNEGAGLSAGLLDMCDSRVRIPIIHSGAESLNVAVSAGILMFALASQ